LLDLFSDEEDGADEDDEDEELEEEEEEGRLLLLLVFACVLRSTGPLEVNVNDFLSALRLPNQTTNSQTTEAKKQQ
jgi:hypothetical protein